MKARDGGASGGFDIGFAGFDGLRHWEDFAIPSVKMGTTQDDSKSSAAASLL